jgi:UDP-2,3-diacylglucosamine pyrophosphatase LpxH
MKKQLVGNDKLGKPIRCNKQILTPGKKGYASIVFWGDVHLGHPKANVERAKAMLDYCLKNHIYVIGMGDYLECGTRVSIGDSVYQQDLNPQEQMEEMLEILRPLADAKLLLGLHEGNHEQRISNLGGLNIVKNMCRELDVPFLGYTIFHYIRVGKQGYTLYTSHGKSGAKFKHSKMKVVSDLAAYVEADVVGMGHVHENLVTHFKRMCYDSKAKTVKERKVFLLISGAYLEYDASYAQDAGMPPAGLGSPKLQFYADKWDIHASV